MRRRARFCGDACGLVVGCSFLEGCGVRPFPSRRGGGGELPGSADFEAAFLLQTYFQLNHPGAKSRVLIFEGLGELSAAVPVDGHFESGDALQAPLGVGKGLDEFAFAQAGFASAGAGRYMGGLAPDVVMQPNGILSPIHAYSRVAGFEFAPNKATGLYAYYSGLHAQGTLP